MSKPANFLEVDESIISKNLLLHKPSEKPVDFLDGLVGGSGGDFAPSRLYTPTDKKEQTQAKFIIPIPGVCIKSKDKISSLKFFMNLCHSEDVAEPDFDYPDDKLATILDEASDAEVDDIRIPMSIGELHKDKDKSGSECIACDVIINSKFFENKIMKSEMYRTFLIVVAFEGIDEKHKLELEKNAYTTLHNRKHFGKLNPQFVRQKPGIRELKDTTGPFASTQSTTSSLIQSSHQEMKKTKLVQEVSTTDLKLDFVITQLSPELAQADIKLPNLRNPSKLSVKLGADRIIVDSPNGCLDVFVPLDIHQEESRAEYDPEKMLLTITMPLITKP